jgi:hypothetical protein
MDSLHPSSVPDPVSGDAMPDIPFVAQRGEMHCGAACLEMIYGAFGIRRTQEDIFDERAVPWPRDPARKYIRTHSLVRDMLDHGLHAVGLKARDIVEALRICDRRGIPAILAQRRFLNGKDMSGHFRVFAGLDMRGRFVIHDPVMASATAMTPRLLQRYSAALGPDVMGNWLIAAGIGPVSIAQCADCTARHPDSFTCRRHDPPARIPMSLQAIAECTRAECEVRAFTAFLCPDCDTIRGRPPSPVQRVAWARALC